MDEEWETIAKMPAVSPGKRARQDSMCYIIFTSGSTGRPKGAVLQHAGVINYLHCLTQYAFHHCIVGLITICDTMYQSQHA